MTNAKTKSPGHAAVGTAREAAALSQAFGMSCGKYLLAYSLLFSLLALLVFSVLLAQGKTFVWRADGMKQHLQALIYIGMWLRGIAANIVEGGGFVVPTYSFSMGYGQDIVANLSFYGIGDPLNWLSAFVPARCTYILFNVLCVLRLWLSGLFFSLLCRQLKLGNWQACATGALLYSFSMFGLCAVARHPLFLDAMVYFPLVLLGVERILQQRKPGVFVAGIALAAASNFYFFYMIFVLMAVYIVVRLACLHGRRGLRGALKDFGRLFAYGCVGLLLACPLFLPSVLAFLADARSPGQAGIALNYSLQHYEAFIFGLASVADPGDWCLQGMGITVVLALLALYSHKGRHLELKIYCALLFVLALLPVGGVAMNGFSYASNRWSWGLNLVLAIILVAEWDRLLNMSNRQLRFLGALCLGYLGLSLLCGMQLYSLWQAALVCCFEAAVLLTLFATVILKRKVVTGGSGTVSFAGGVVMALAMAGVVVNSLLLYAPFAGAYSNVLLSPSGVSESLNNEAREVKQLAGNDDAPNGFWRYSGSYASLHPNAGLLAGAPSTDYYWSLSNSSICSFMEELGVNTREYEVNRYRNLDNRAILQELAGVRYYVCNSDEAVAPGFSMLEENPLGQGWNVYKNAYALPFAYAFESATGMQDFSNMSMLQRQQALIQGAVLDEVPAGIQQASLQDDSQALDFEVQPGEGVTMLDAGNFQATGGSTITILCKGLPASETYLQVENLSYTGAADKLDMYATFTCRDSSQYSNCLSFSTASYERSSGRQDFLLNSGYTESPVQQIVLQFPADGSYHMDLSLLCLGMQNYLAEAQALQQRGCENLDLHYLNSRLAASNQVDFSIDLEAASVVSTAIPYSAGWSATVDGQPAKMQKVNLMYTGLVIDAGQHNVHLSYKTPGLIPGLALFALGLALLLALNLHARRH